MYRRATEPCAVPRPGKKKKKEKIKEPAVERSLWVAAWMLADIWSLTIKVGWDSWTRRKRSGVVGGLGVGEWGGGEEDETWRSGAAVVWGLIPWRHSLPFLREIRPIGWRREKGNDLWRRRTWKRRVNTLIVKNERAQTRGGRLATEREAAAQRGSGSDWRKRVNQEQARNHAAPAPGSVVWQRATRREWKRPLRSSGALLAVREQQRLRKITYPSKKRGKTKNNDRGSSRLSRSRRGQIRNCVWNKGCLLGDECGVKTR